MDGITILNTIECTKWFWLWVVLAVLSAISLYACIMGIVSGEIKVNNKTRLTIGMIFVTLIMSLTLGGGYQIKTGEVEYQVLIDDSVTLKEFENRYHIIDKQSEIYTIKEVE